MTKEEILKKDIDKYFTTLALNGIIVSKDIRPADEIFKKEVKFIKYLDENHLECMFCHKRLIVIHIDSMTQRPVWGCYKDKFTKGLQKIKWLDHCGSCGVKLNLKKRYLEDQKEYINRDNVVTCCENCISLGHELTDQEVKNIRKKDLGN